MEYLMKTFDIFLSYKSEDAPEVERLRDALLGRGVRVWLDKNQIRPGDLFAQALENGLSSSKAVGLVVTPESVRSEWVKGEYYRALSLANKGSLQLIPLMFRDCELPGFLADRQYVDFRDPTRFEENVDKIVWPGITGKTPLFVAVSPIPTGSSRFFPLEEHPNLQHLEFQRPWFNLQTVLNARGLRLEGGSGINRSIDRVARERANRIIAVVDVFEGWPYCKRNQKRCMTPRQYVELIFKLRMITQHESNEVIFLLFHHSTAMGTCNHHLNISTMQRLSHYFTLHSDTALQDLPAAFHDVWLRIQQDLLQREDRP
jgi:hypothetical protein